MVLGVTRNISGYNSLQPMATGQIRNAEAKIITVMSEAGGATGNGL